MSTRKRQNEEEVQEEGHPAPESHHEAVHAEGTHDAAAHAAHNEAHVEEVIDAEPLPETLDEEASLEEVSNSDLVGKVATIAVVGVGAAIISAELIPGMLIGVAAAFLPGIGPKLRPFMKSTIRAGYAAVKKTKEMVAEAGEQMQDVVAEARSEHHEAEAAATAPKTTPAAA